MLTDKETEEYKKRLMACKTIDEMKPILKEIFYKGVEDRKRDDAIRATLSPKKLH